MKKNLFKFLVLAVLATFVTFTACKDYADDINKLEEEISAFKADFPSKIDAFKTELTNTIDGKIGTVTGELNTLKGELATLQEKGATKAELDAVKQDILEKTVALSVYNSFKDQVTADLSALKEGVENAATKAELEAYQEEVTAKFAKISGTLETLGGGLKDLKTDLEALRTKHDTDKADLLKEISKLEGKLNPRITIIETLLDIEDGESAVLEGIDKELKGIKGDLATLKDILKVNEDGESDELEAIKGRVKKLEDNMDKVLSNLGLSMENILTLSYQLKGLTFIPTRGLPMEKTMKLYYFAGDYTANHTLMYRVNPSQARLGKDFEIVSLNYQVTTRSASDGVADGSEKVSVTINGEVTQKGDIIYVPVHIEGPTPCEVYGNIDWWSNEFFNECITCNDWEGLSPNNFPAVQSNEGNIEGHKGLSLVLTATTTPIKGSDSDDVVYVKSSEMVNTQLIPTQIKLAESPKGQGNEDLKENLTARLLPFTLSDATDWANQNENALADGNKNWNVLAWSGNQGEGGVWTPGKIDLNKYVSSLYYPQDGGDLSHKDITGDDPHRYLYNYFGTFGEPYSDTPDYEKPVYEFEQMVYKDENHDIVIGPEGGKGVTHSYASIEDGSMLTIFNTKEAIQGVRNKKLIIKVTQVNSECAERQPVGYLVIKYTDDPTNEWPDAEYTIDLTGFPYFHKACGQEINGAQVIPEEYSDGNAGVTFTTKDALLNLFTADRFMNPINAPASYGLSGEINPGDVHYILAGNLQLNGIGEHNMGNIYNIQGRDAAVESKSFTAADYNHVNDTENKAATGVTADEAFSHVMIRYEYAHHSYIVYVDDHAPAGDYEITYLLENKQDNTQHGNRLFLTFKFKVAMRGISVEHDKNTVNWQDDNKTIRVQHTRISNTEMVHSFFLLNEGYRVDLKEAFILKDGTVDISTKTIEADTEGRTVGDAPSYNPMFEFVQDEGITAAGFVYERDEDNFVTEIWKDDKLAAQIINDPDPDWNDTFDYLFITANEAGDELYNYLMQDMWTNNDIANHNVWTKWGKTELTLTDDGERVLPVRLVTDINQECAGQDYEFPYGNYYYIDEFNIKFERALRWAFTTVELTDDQNIQAYAFTFAKKDEDSGIYRGLFDHAYEAGHGYGNLVYPGRVTDYTFTDPAAQAWYYGLEEAPWMEMTDWDLVLHVEDVACEPGLGPITLQEGFEGDYHALDFDQVEISTDGGETWAQAPKDYSSYEHQRRYFNVIQFSRGTFVALWQGDQTAITSPIYFRVPVGNETAIDEDQDLHLAPDADGNYWMTFRHGRAKVKGYAVFKINPRE